MNRLTKLQVLILSSLLAHSLPFLALEISEDLVNGLQSENSIESPYPSALEETAVSSFDDLLLSPLSIFSLRNYVGIKDVVYPCPAANGVIYGDKGLSFDGKGKGLIIDNATVLAGSTETSRLIFSKKDLSFKNFSLLQIENSSSLGITSNSTSLIEGETLSVSHCNTVCLRAIGALQSSTSSSRVFRAKTIKIDNNNLLCCSHSNASYGAFSAQQITLAKNLSVLFKNNSASREGGALFTEQGSQSCINIDSNGSAVFSYNQALRGGAIKTYNQLSLIDNGSIIFEGNKATEQGGAIDISPSLDLATKKDSVIKGNFEVVFSRNISPIGPAICLSGDAQSSLSIFADKGDITFIHNAETESNTIARLCAIRVQPDTTKNEYPTLSCLCATDGHDLTFYDPVIYTSDVNVSPSKKAVILNGDPSSSSDTVEYTGTIRFSSSQLPSSFMADSLRYDESRTSVFAAPLELRNGTLAIDSKTFVMTPAFQQKGGTILLGSGSLLEAYGETPTWENAPSLSLKHLTIDLDSFLDVSQTDGVSASSPAYIYAKSGQVDLNNGSSCPLEFTCSDNFAMYGQYEIGSEIPFPILTLTDDPTANQLRVQGDFSFPREVIVSPSTGYTGKIALSTDSSSPTIYGIWKPTGYTVSKAFRSPTHLNTSWIGVAAARAASGPLIPNTLSLPKGKTVEIVGKALFSFLSFGSENQEDLSKFNHSGYATDLLIDSSDTSVRLSFSKLKGVSTNWDIQEQLEASHYVAGLAFQKNLGFQKYPGTLVSLSTFFCQGENTLYSLYSDKVMRKLSSISHSLLSTMTVAPSILEIFSHNHTTQLAAFVKGEYVMADLPFAYEEEVLPPSLITRQRIQTLLNQTQRFFSPLPAKLRRYSSSSLREVTASAGLSFESVLERRKTPFSVQAAAAFLATPFRQSPSAILFIANNDVPVTVYGSSLDLYAIELSSSVNFKVLPILTCSIDYKGKISRHDSFNSIEAGGSIFF